MTDVWVLDPQLAADTCLVASLELSDVLLMDNAHYPWIVVVPRVVAATEWIDLPERDQHRLLDEVATCSRVLRALYAPDKLNIAALGNVVAQLHVHVVARRTTDSTWPRPVWGGPAERYGEEARAEAVERLRAAIDSADQTGDRSLRD